ncbi:MAG: DUF4338 domain-containing protein [Desulfitobacteriaceae bacterium]|nr:DUF4338 domain-containing protein [Desulfitobacteriaceae bacterium]MDI6915954.1 DUF4338 domain-containing protein [Desulfitobacteriaceae bacterium]
MCNLQALTPLTIDVVQSPQTLRLFKYLLAEHHYLGYSGTVGENMKYMVYDRMHRPLACLLFGSAAWKVADRDNWIGWDIDTRQARLHLITNNVRFLGAIIEYIQQLPKQAQTALLRELKMTDARNMPAGAVLVAMQCSLHLAFFAKLIGYWAKNIH